MKAFQELIEVSNRLNDPHTGCPWDIKQTFTSLQKYILEEACELIDAVDVLDIDNMIEELGDVLYVVIFYCKVAEREQTFTLEKVLEVLKEKLMRRHPHVFGELQCQSSEEVEIAWKKIKQKEKEKRSSVLEGVPRSLTALARAQKILSKLIEHECEEIKSLSRDKISEDVLGEQMVGLILQAERHGLDAEKALRKALTKYEHTLSRLQ
jgi:MazG family protein